MNNEHITPKQIAIEFESDPKTIRKFLRSLTDDRAGKGGRWAIDANDLPALRIKFDEFIARKTTTLIISND